MEQKTLRSSVNACVQHTIIGAVGLRNAIKATSSHVLVAAVRERIDNSIFFDTELDSVLYNYCREKIPKRYG